jgi:hypothetical protein
VGTPSHGRAIGNNDNTITYMRTNADQISDSFTYTITDSRGGTATATVHITVPKPVISVTLEGPPDIYKGVDGLGIPVGGYTWFVFRRTGPTTSPMFFTFFLGGDGTAQYPFPYPAYAKYPEDFDEVTGANKAPFPNGFYFTFPVGVSEMTIGVQTVHDETVPEDPYMYQDLLCTVPDVGVNGPYDPDPNAWQGHAFIHPYPYWW